MGRVRVVLGSDLVEVAGDAEHPALYADHGRDLVREQLLVPRERLDGQGGRHDYHFQRGVLGWVLLRFLFVIW